jgi:sarcosine oxidase, subunit gamma
MPERSSLALDRAAAAARWTGNGIAIEERPGRGAIALRLRGETEIRLAAAVLPVDFAGPVGLAAQASGVTGLRLAPDEWLILCDRAEEERLTPALQRFVSTHSGSAVAVGNGTVSIQCAGSRAHLLLNKGTSLDLHPRSFAPGHCAATGFGKIRVVVWRQELERFSLHVGRSFARSFWDWLVDSAREWAR